MPVFLHDLFLRLFVSLPVLLFCLAAGPWLVRRGRLGGWAASAVGLALVVGSVVFCEWQVRPLLHGKDSTSGFLGYLFFQIISAANAASATPLSWWAKRDPQRRTAP